MSNPTTPFSWQMPTATDLVTDLPADFEVFGQAVATSMADLLGGTSGQVLAKNSNTDMDFVWVAQDDSNAIQNTIVDAKGDLIAASASDVPARLAVGSNGETLVADSSTSTGLRYTGNYAAGKNKIINGDFNVNQRNFSSSTVSAEYNLDRWRTIYTGGTSTTSVQVFTPGAAPVAGYEGKNYYRVAITGQSASTDFVRMQEVVESVRTFAGQTTTYSFWAKADAGTPKVAIISVQAFGGGGSPSTAVLTEHGTVTLSTAWTRYSVTCVIPSISGKTIGTDGSDGVSIRPLMSAGTDVNGHQGIGVQNYTFETWGHQWEAGSVATAFQTATGTLQGELAACQRYYYRTSVDGVRALASGLVYTTTNSLTQMPFPVTMRIRPTGLEQSGTASNYASMTSGTTLNNCTAVPAFDQGTTNSMAVIIGVASGLVVGNFTYLFANSSAGYLGWSAEL
jgi:hypothetical protein